MTKTHRMEKFPGQEKGPEQGLMYSGQQKKDFPLRGQLLGTEDSRHRFHWTRQFVPQSWSIHLALKLVSSGKILKVLQGVPRTTHGCQQD